MSFWIWDKAKFTWDETQLIWELAVFVGGGDFDDWKANGAAPPDNVLRQLSSKEQDELVDIIKKSQELSKKK